MKFQLYRFGLLKREGSGQDKEFTNGGFSTVIKGFPDIEIYGGGFEMPKWRWNGKEYVFYKNEKMK